MLVRLSKEQRMAGPNGNYGPGSETIVDDITAKQLEKGGAIIIRKIEEEKKEEKKEIETAMVQPPENEAIKKGRPRTIKDWLK